jgi:hypothetical protein
MRISTLHEARDTVAIRRIAAVAALTAAAAAGVWPARSSAQLPSTACAQIQSDADRLACYDRAYPPAAAGSAKPAAPAVVPPAAPARSLPEAVPADGASHVATEPRTEARGARGSAAEPPLEPAAPAAPGAATVARTAPAPAQTAQVEADIIPIVIVSVHDTPGRNAKVFTADNGSVWIQTDSVAMNMPDTPFNAQIKKGVVGSFFLVPTNKGRSVRVRRAEN